MEPFRQKVLLWHREAPLFLRVWWLNVLCVGTGVDLSVGSGPVILRCVCTGADGTARAVSSTRDC